MEKEMATQSSILACKTHRQRSLECYSPRGHKQQDPAEQRGMDAISTIQSFSHY